MVVGAVVSAVARLSTYALYSAHAATSPLAANKTPKAAEINFNSFTSFSIAES
jgi:hypothetical protein